MKRILHFYALRSSRAAAAFAGSVVLKKAWVKQYKDRATIDASFTVDHAHKNPNAAVKDGDMHVAGRSPKQVGLPLVAEVVNARSALRKDGAYSHSFRRRQR